MKNPKYKLRYSLKTGQTIHEDSNASSMEKAISDAKEKHPDGVTGLVCWNMEHLAKTGA